MILSGYPLDTLWVSHEGKKKTVIGVPKDETPIGTLRHFPSTLRGKKKKAGLLRLFDMWVRTHHL